MEAKGCAKPIAWKHARRYFYWATRARVACSTALATLAEASPSTTYQYRLNLVNTIAGIQSNASNQVIAAALEGLDLRQTVIQLKADCLVRNAIDLAREDRKTTIDSLHRLVDTFSDEERAELLSILQPSRPAIVS